MSKQIILREATQVAPTKSGNKWRAVVATPGQGTSGFYPAEVLKRDAALILPEGAQAFINHDSDRRPTDMIGVWSEGAWDEDENAVVSELHVFSHWKEFVEEVGPHCGISIYASGEADEDGNVTQFFESRLNGADLVSRPGLVGSGLAQKLYESAIEQNEDPSVTPARDRKETKMDQEMKDAFAALTTLIAPLVAKEQAEADAKAQKDADEIAVSAAVDAFESAVEAIESADLTPGQKKALRAEAKAGKDVAPLIETAKAVKAEIVGEIKTEGASAPQGFVYGSTATVESATDLGKVL